MQNIKFPGMGGNHLILILISNDFDFDFLGNQNHPNDFDFHGNQNHDFDFQNDFDFD